MNIGEADAERIISTAAESAEYYVERIVYGTLL